MAKKKPVVYLNFPVPAFNFAVTMFGVNAEFSEVTGLKVTTEFKEVKSGGENNKLYKIPMRTSCGEVTFKRGVFKSSETNVITSADAIKEIRKAMNFEAPVIAPDAGKRIPDITISLNDESGVSVTTWVLLKPSIVSYELSTLSASSNEIAFETLVIAPSGITIV